MRSKVGKYIREEAPRLAAILVVAFALLATLPALWISLGHPWEGDAVDYRVPLLKWILRHETYPNWTWTPVEDYPFLGELFMLPFFAVHGGLARLVPILGYALAAWFAGAIYWELAGKKSGLRRAEAFLLGMAWTLPFRPLALQSNLLMTDNLASAFCLGAVFFAVRGSAVSAGLLLALAMATKYFAWGASVAVFVCLAHALGYKRATGKSLAVFCAIGALGALPFAVRNFLVNDGNPVFPMFTGLFGQEGIGLRYNLGGYGRGQGLVALLLFPYDFLVTNNFLRDIYDYTLGKLFFFQLAGAFFVAAWKPKEFAKFARARFADRRVQAAVLFSFVFFLAWFFTSQQLRFLVASAVIWNLFLLDILRTLAPKPALAAAVALGIFSVHSIQSESFALATGKRASVFAAGAAEAADCFQRAGVLESDLMGYAGRDGIAGFFDYDFVFVLPNVYRVDFPDKPSPEPDFIYGSGDQPRAGYERWPALNPCLWKKTP